MYWTGDLRTLPKACPVNRHYTQNELNIAQGPLVDALPINFNGHGNGFRNIKFWEMKLRSMYQRCINFL